MTSQQSSTVLCIICENEVPEARARAGTLYANGRQAFACMEHMWNKAAWLLAWMRFSVSQSKHVHAEVTQGSRLEEAKAS